MAVDDLSQRVTKLSNCIDDFQARCISDPANAAKVLSDALEELQISLEELSAADEELMQQNEELVKAQVALQEAKGQLEIRVKERTVELEQANVQLREEIAERKHAEESLRVAGAYNRSLIEASLDSLVTIGLDGKITDVNAATEAVTGYSRGELIGTDFSDYFTEPGKASDGYQHVFKEGSVRDYALEIQCRDGHITPVLYNASVYRNDIGGVIGVFAAARDITERKQAEKALRMANAYNRSLIEASLDPLVTIGPDGKITDGNAATEAVTGYSRGELIGTDFSDYFTEPDKARDGYQHVFKEGLVLDYALEIRHRDGYITPVLYNASVYRNDAGDVIGVFAAARDVTAQKQASQYARSLIESSLDPLVTINADGKVTDVNEATVKVTGIPREQLIGTDFSNYFTEPEKAREGYQQVFAQGFVTDYPLTIQHRDGKLTDVLYNASIYKDTRGNILGVFAAARDITERKQAEIELDKYREHLEELVGERTRDLEAANAKLQAEITERKRAEEALRAQTEMMDLANILVMDRDGRIIFWNKGAEEQYGFTKEDTIGIGSHELLQTRFPQPLAEIMVETLRDGHWKGELTHIKHDGTPIIVASHWVLYRDTQGKPTTIIEVNNDITERKRMEEELRRSKDELEQRVRERTSELSDAKENLEVINGELQVEISAHEKTEKELIKAKDQALEAVRAKAAFLANMSHELRTPMNAVIGFTSLLLDDSLTPEQKERLEIIRNGGEALLAIINDILELSRAEKKRVELEHQTFSLRSCIEESLEQVSVQANKRGLDLAYTIKYGAPDAFLGDLGRLRQILANLLSNAVKFTDEGAISISVASKALVDNKHQLQFAVKDTGIGIPQEKMDQLFQPFSQVETTISRKRDGAGLGLAICKGLVELMGGSIWAKSEVGNGSTFYFTIEVEATKDLSAKSETEAPFIGNLYEQYPLRILVAEDNPSNQRVLVEMLRKLGYRADAVADGKEVLQSLERQPYDLVFMDVKMPEMDGLLATREIRRRWPSGPKIVAITAYALAGDKEKCLEAGMDDYIAKPVQKGALAEALRRCSHKAQ